MRYYAISAPQFEVTSGGTRVMFGLYGHLLARGYVAFMNQYPAHTKDFVAIYPEIVRGNPFGADHVVRYILNKPGVVSAVDNQGNAKTGPTEFDSNDKLYYFSRLFGKTDHDHYMFLPIINTDVFFKQKGVRRTKTAYFVGKGINTFKHPKDAILIDRQFAQNQQALADLLNECEVLYQYDPVSAMSEIARLCGCKVKLFQDWFTKKEYLEYEPGMSGISWEGQDFESFNSNTFMDHYKDMKFVFGKQLDKFIKDTQS